MGSAETGLKCGLKVQSYGTEETRTTAKGKTGTEVGVLRRKCVQSNGGKEQSNKYKCQPLLSKFYFEYFVLLYILEPVSVLLTPSHFLTQVKVFLIRFGLDLVLSCFIPGLNLKHFYFLHLTYTRKSILLSRLFMMPLLK